MSAARLCSIDGCDCRHFCRGCCKSHYYRLVKYGDPLWSPPTREQRFWAKVDRSGGSDSCWEWQGGKDPKGYGVFGVATNRTGGAHRFAYVITVGPVPEGLELDHLCRNPGCVNPSHLEPVTHRENVMRGEGVSAKHAAKVTCIHGHPLDGFKPSVGWRYCKTCNRLRSRGRKAA